MSNLLELAARVEALTGPCPKVAKDIYRALFGAPELGQPGGYGWREDDAGWWLATGEDARTPPRTIYPPKWLSSLDAARSLVPEGWFVYAMGEAVTGIRCVGDRHERINFYADLQHRDGGRLKKAEGALQELALTAAALRARAGADE